MLLQINTFCFQQKELGHKGGQRYVNGACIVSYILKLMNDTSQDKVTLSSEEIKHVALSIVKLCLAGGICQAGVSRKF